MAYEIKWITSYLGVGRAPMSYEEFDDIKAEGVKGIVNLCHEFSDLHTLEEQAGFEVYYLPTYDEYAPDIDELDKALFWLDEMLYLKKKVLVHCRFGQGRTGTFTSAYLLRRGLDLKKTKKELAHSMAKPETYRQWKTLKKFKKLQGNFSIKQPTVEHTRYDDMTGFYQEYTELARLVDEEMKRVGVSEYCGKRSECCCNTTFYMPLIEALYISEKVSSELTSIQRNEAIERALGCREQMKNSLQCLDLSFPVGMREIHVRSQMVCPLSVEGSCILFENRPIRCRSNGGVPLSKEFMDDILGRLTRLSNETFLALAGQFPEDPGIYSSLIDTVSGKFIQTYFHLMAAVKR